MAPIRVGLVGLSAGGGWAPAAHLPYLQSSPKYIITALCNSSVESGNEAIRQYNLQSAKAYDSVESMCDSDTVDLVVCSVAVFSHYKLAKPAIERGKDVYVEWPLCGTTEEAKELTQLAKEKGVRTIIGLQSQGSEVHSTVKEILDSGRIGRVLASHIVGSSGTQETGNRLDKRYRYFKDRHSEGTKGQVTLTIYVGHTMDYITSLLGHPRTVSAQLQTTWPYVDILDGEEVIERNVEKTADDYASLHGVTDHDVKYTYVLRGGDAFQKDDGLVWDIVGEMGQIRVTGATIMLNLGAENYKVQVKNYATKTIETVPLHEKLPIPLYSRNVGVIYERFADEKPVPTFEDGVRMHEFLDAMFASNGNHGSVQKFTDRWESL